MRYPVSFALELGKHNLPGTLVAIEGIDGTGKTTQSRNLVQKLTASGFSALYTKEPTDGEIGRFIRKILAGEKKFEPFAFQYLFVADRVEHQKETLGYLADGKVVVSDRFFWSSIPYGGTDRGLDFEKENGDTLLSAFGILSCYNQFIAPDITIYLSSKTDTVLERLAAARHTPDIYDKREKLENISKGYKWLVKKFPEQFVTVDGNKSVDDVSKEIFEHVQKILK